MNQNAAAPIESAVPLFDVFIEIPPHARLETIERLARQETGLSPERVDSLMKALRSGPKSKIGAAVSQERSQAAKEQFSKIGLTVTVVPVLALQTIMAGAVDTRFLCPACNEKVDLPANRQCPKCDVFVDKVSPEMLLKRKILMQERAKLEFQTARDNKESEKKSLQAMEAAIRAKIRKELEAEFGLDKKAGFFEGKSGLIRSLGMVAALAVAAGSGYGLRGGASSGEQPISGSQTSDAKVDQMLNAALGATQAGSAPNETGTTSATGDPDIDNDPMMQAIGANRAGAKGLSLEQALGAATTLAKSVGKNASENVNNPGKSSTGMDGGAISSNTVEVSLPPGLKLQMAAEFTLALAELGQLQRAKAILKTLKSSPTWSAEPQAASTLRMVDVQIQAWALNTQPESKARQAADTLRADIQAISDPMERALALSRVGGILSQQQHLASEVSQAFLTLGSNAIKAIPSAQDKSIVMDEWMVSMGTVLLAEATTHARAGRWIKTQRAVAGIEDLSAQASDPTTHAKLLALDFRAKLLIDQTSAAQTSLASALALANQNIRWVDRAKTLRTIANSAGEPGRNMMAAAAESMEVKLELVANPDQAQALVQLALLHANAGTQESSDRLRKRALAATGFSPIEMRTIQADLWVRGDLAFAKAAHTAGNYAQSEILLQRVGTYLL